MQTADVPGETQKCAKSSADNLKSDINKIKTMAMGVATASILSTLNPSAASAKDKVIWSKINLPVRDTLFDITFDPKKPDHGWLVGAKGTFFETFDGGNTWNTRAFTNLDEGIYLHIVCIVIYILPSATTHRWGNQLSVRGRWPEWQRRMDRRQAFHSSSY